MNYEPMDPAEFDRVWAEKMQEAKQADDARAFVQAYNSANRDLEADEDEKLQAAVEAYEALDEQLAPGGIFAGLPASEKLRLQTAAYKDHGARPELLTPAEIAENERAEAAAESARLRSDLELWNLQMVQDKGYASVADYKAGKLEVRPYLADRGVGEPRAYVLPHAPGEVPLVVEEFVAIDGRVHRDPRFDQIHAREQKLSGASR